LHDDILKLQTDDIISRTRLMENEIKILKSEIMRISHEHQSQKEKIKENKEKIKLNKTLPYLVSNVIEASVKHFLFLSLFLFTEEASTNV
jgi:26S proteasome regulatory subunit T5